MKRQPAPVRRSLSWPPASQAPAAASLHQRGTLKESEVKPIPPPANGCPARPERAPALSAETVAAIRALAAVADALEALHRLADAYPPLESEAGAARFMGIAEIAIEMSNESLPWQIGTMTECLGLLRADIEEAANRAS